MVPIDSDPVVVVYGGASHLAIHDVTGCLVVTLLVDPDLHSHFRDPVGLV